MGNLRHLVLQSFKNLHRTRMKVFSDDLNALSAARHKINEEYKKNKHIEDAESIKAMIKFGEDVEKELRTQIIQAQEIKPGVYKVKITEETAKVMNIPFNKNAVMEDEGRQNTPCCQSKQKNK